MRAVVQVVDYAKLSVDDKVVSQIDKGFLVLLGIKTDDTIKDAEYIINKVSKLRVFNDENDKLNLSLKDVGGNVLVVSNFTIYGDTRGQNRPSYSHAAKSEISKPLYDYVITNLNKIIPTVGGVFGAHMIIDMQACGPCTILIDSEKTI